MSGSYESPKKDPEAALQTNEPKASSQPLVPATDTQRRCGIMISFGDTPCNRPCVSSSEYCMIHQSSGVILSSQKKSNQSHDSTNLASPPASGSKKLVSRQRHRSITESKTEAAPVDRRFPAIGYPEEARCQATTTRGRACLYVATKNSRYCNLHADFDANPPSARRKQSVTPKQEQCLKSIEDSESKFQKVPEKGESNTIMDPPLSKQFSQASTMSTLSAPTVSSHPAMKEPNATARNLTPTQYFSSLVSNATTASQGSAGLCKSSNATSGTKNSLGDEFAHSVSKRANNMTRAELGSGDGCKVKQVAVCGTHGCSEKVVANAKVAQNDMNKKNDSDEAVQSNHTMTAAVTGNSDTIMDSIEITEAKDDPPPSTCSTPKFQNSEKQDSSTSAACPVKLPTVLNAEEHDVPLTPKQNSSTSFSQKIKVPRQTSSNRTPISSPKLTRGFLHDKSLLRKPSKGEEHYSFWVKLWPHLVKIGWTFKSNPENDGFQFRSPPTENNENGIIYYNVPKVLELVEKMPTMSYYLTEMVLAETSQVDQSDEHENQDDDMQIDTQNQTDQLCTAASQGKEKKLQSEGVEDKTGYGEVSSDENKSKSLDRPLSSIPYQHWIGTVVSIAKGSSKGMTGKIIRTGSGWVTMENLDDRSITFSRRASDLTVVKLAESAATMQFTIVADEVGSDPSISAANVGEQSSSQKPRGKRKSSSQSPTPVPALQNLPRRTVQKPVRYEDHAMIESKKRSRIASPAIASPAMIGDQPDVNRSMTGPDDGYSADDSLSSLPQSCWINRRVRVMAGPMKGRIGITYKVHYGWVYVKITSGAEDDEACRRAPDLALVENGEVDESEKVIVEEEGVPSVSDNDKGTGKLLSSVPIQRWPGMLVKVKFGVWSGRYARILRSNNGWIHLSADLISDYRRIENYDTCRRAFELEVVNESSGASDGEECVEAMPVLTPEHEKKKTVRLVESVGEMDVEDVSVESVPSSVPSTNSSPQRLAGFRMSSTPISPGSVRALVLGAKSPGMPKENENPYANKKIMIGSSYQVSMSSMPPMPSETNGEPVKQITDHERLKSMLKNCTWDCNANINSEELGKLLADFGLNDEVWIRSLVMQGIRKGEVDPMKYARSEIMNERVGSLRLDLVEEEDSKKFSHTVTVAHGEATQKRRKYRMLGASNAFHKKARTANLRVKQYHSVTLSQMVNNTFKSWSDPVMQEAFEHSGWADASSK